MGREEHIKLALLEGCINGSPIPAFVIGRDHRILYWNRALEELSQIKAQDVIGTDQQWRAFYANKRPCLADLLVSGALEEIPNWYLDKFAPSSLIDEAYEAIDFFPELGNSGRWLRFTAAVIRDQQGEVLGAIETLEDITARIKAEEALKKAYNELESRVEERTRELAISNEELKRTTEQLTLILDSLPIVTYIREAGGNLRFSYLSNSVEEITGLSPRLFLENDHFWESRIHPDDRPLILRKIRKEQGTKVNRTTYRFLAADDSYRWFADYSRIIRLPNVRERYIVGIWQDVSEEIRLRQERDFRLQEMIQTQKLSALGEVVAGVAHEINNPVSFISYNVPLLEEIWQTVEQTLLDLDEEPSQWRQRGLKRSDISRNMREIIEAFKISSTRINRVISGLKEFARVEEVGKRDIISVENIIQTALVIVGPQLKKNIITLEMSISPHLPSIKGHLQRLEQVVTNLLINAHQSIPPDKKGRIVIEARHIARMGAVAIAIEDNGRGMTREIMDNLFHPFFTTRRDSGGTGLGLSISYGIVKEHGGTIGVLSQPGVGSRFTVFLPVETGRQLRLFPAILCLDPDEKYAKEMADNLPHVLIPDFTTPLRSEYILDYLTDHPEIDIILSEIQLSGLTGWELVRAVKARFPLINVILYSSDPTQCETPQDIIGDARCLLKKPFSMEQLLLVISEIGRQRL
ncbi:MAG TPA: ATP-binding protein [Syntrophales bacterium]|nr:ATP-binding protein [Syntrophales bacterium]HOL59390.1 ATP-binding protein [Syntrophales bacterium]HPO35547.1 ATP-binding protein [Syntrophales bacterium]